MMQNLYNKVLLRALSLLNRISDLFWFEPVVEKFRIHEFLELACHFVALTSLAIKLKMDIFLFSFMMQSLFNKVLLWAIFIK